MEKLINLLNEYEAKRHKTSVIADIRKGEDKLSYLEMNWNYSELLCISKGYEFVKWLVQNNKIDFDKVNKVYYEKIYCEIDGQYHKFVDFMNEDILLMRLSIKDNPIEFLISVLK